MDNKSLVISRNCILLFVVLLLLPVVVNAGWAGAGRELKAKRDRIVNFDFQILALQWDPEVDNNTFTIHGLWPEYNDGTYPEKCKGEGIKRFVESTISKLIPQLTKAWPSNTGENVRFWKGEFNKHGTCSNLKQLEYFQTTLQLHSQFDVKAALAKSGIVPHPSRTYNTSQIRQSIISSFGYNPLVHCHRDISVLVEVGICFDAAAKNPINCPDKLNKYFQCQPSFTFPTFGDYASDSGSTIGPTPEDRPKVIVFLVIAACCIVLLLLAQKFATRYYMRKSKDYVERE